MPPRTCPKLVIVHALLPPPFAIPPFRFFSKAGVSFHRAILSLLVLLKFPQFVFSLFLARAAFMFSKWFCFEGDQLLCECIMQELSFCFFFLMSRRHHQNSQKNAECRNGHSNTKNSFPAELFKGLKRRLRQQLRSSRLQIPRCDRTGSKN